MLLLGVLGLSLVIGLLRGGRVDAIAEHRWHWPALPLLALGLQVLGFLPDESATSATRVFAAVLHVLSYLLAFVFIWLNRRTPWLWLIGLGVTANALVIIANGGFMPLSAAGQTGASGAAVALKGLHNNSVLLGPDTRLPFLGDVLLTPDWLPLRRAFSIGDLAIGLGAFGLLQRLLHPAVAARPGAGA